MRQALAEERQTQDFHIKKPVLCCSDVFSFHKAIQEGLFPQSSWGNFACPLSCSLQLLAIWKLSAEHSWGHRWGTDHPSQETLGKCGSSSFLVLQCQMLHLYQASKLRSSRWHVWIDFEHLEIVCYLQSPPSKLHLWLHVVNKSLLLWPQMPAVALPFPPRAFLATRTECALPPAVRQTDRKQWQESPLS